MPSLTHTTAAAAGVLAAVASLLTAPPAVAAGPRDVTADVLAGRSVTLDGDTVVTVPPGTTTYDGVFRGEGTLTVRGTGTLVLTRDSDFTLPQSRQRQQVRTPGGNHPYVTVTRPDPPAVTVERGATLQYGDGGTTGLIGRFPYNTPAFRLNQDNIRVDGTLRLSLRSVYNLGTISGSGLITQPRFLWGTWDLPGTHSFSGVIDNGTQANAGRPEYATSLPRVRKILNQGTWTVDTPLGRTVTMGMDFYQREYGSDINVQSRPGGKVVLTGQYSWSDQGGDRNPSLSDPALNWTPARRNVNKRGTNIKGADVRWGDGTTDRIFMPGTAETVYINLLAARSRSRLTFDYNGPVTLGAPIGGGRFHDTLSAPGAGDVVIAGTPGNDVTFAAVQYYDGSTTVEKGAVLRLGSGERGGDGGLYTGGARYRLVNDGSLVVRNTARPLTLSRVGGSGSLTQSGTATTTLTGRAVTYTGPTTVSEGTLALRGGATLTHSRSIRLTSAGARLDPGRPGLRVATTLTGKGIVSGTVANDGTVTTGLTVDGPYTQSRKGTLVLRDKPLTVTGRVRLAGHLDVPAAPRAAREITVLDNKGKARTSGTFTGMREGARLKRADTPYRISYRGGDGNDVVLTAVASPGRSATAQAAPAAPAPANPRSAGASEATGFGWWPYALAAGLTISLAIPVATRRGRNGRRGGRHAGRARR
ncbi:autotransporter-associated beta strand repeat-containing protein [Streptomyces sp. NPDC029044]|uniref:autotransporter-associated beta strand repeat-containing protein n=1 Tax=Streptomyces sp. NPDC029044 TaxID=3157198 RepID=UPI00340076CA